MTNQKQLLLGAFFVVVLAILGYYTLFLTEFSLFDEKHEIVVHFEEAGGLRPGDSVLVAGIRQGRVGTLVYDETADLERRISATLILDDAIVLREGHSIHIEDATLLGGKNVVIDPGPPAATAMPESTVLYGEVRGGALADLGNLVNDNREVVNRILANLEAVSDQIRTGDGLLGRLTSDPELVADVTGAVESFQTFSDNAAALTTDLREGEGTLGRLLKEDDLALQLEEIADGLQKITTDLSGFTDGLDDEKGLVWRLLHDEQLSTEVDDTVAAIRDIVDRVNAGEGNLGRLLNDDTAMSHIESILGKVDRGEGTVGKLVSSEDIYQKLDEIADNVATVTAALSQGEGTLGRLLVDDELYAELQKALELVTRSLEEYREAAPVTTFTSVLFGGF